MPEIASSAASVSLGEHEAALLSARRGLEANPAFAPGHIVIALCLVRLERLEEAQEAVRRLLDIAPDTSVATVPERLLFSDALYKGFLDDLRAAGLPE
jgi:adenylate cyclase